MKSISFLTILASGLLHISFFSKAKADVCLMLYQLADNDLEYFIRQDNNELIRSTAIREPTLTTWVYFDSRNYGTNEDITEPLQDVYNFDGTPIESKYEGSLYMNWDHVQEKMIVNASSSRELNGDDPQTLSDFMAYAMLDCVARGSTEYMLIMSSHGSGMLGFGGDENTAESRRLAQANQFVVSAVQSVLDSVEGAPDKLDVLGFDACLMQSVDALDEYRNITRYYLASEAVEPGHGWAYDYLEPAATALEYATNLHDNFLQQTQGMDFHLTPKTIAIVETDKFTVFLDAWDALFAELNNQILMDKNVHTITQRARLNSLAFMGAVDKSDTNTPSSLDIGSFFETFRTLCSIDPNSELELLQQSAEAAYADMFVSTGVGPGTPAASGMHILWPQRRVYQQGDLYHVLLNETFLAATGDAPNWIDFLESFYEAPAPDDVSENSVCLVSVISELEEDVSDGRLLLSPEVVVNDEAVVASSDVAAVTDAMFVRYGLDVSVLLEGRLRHLKEATPSTFQSNQQNSFPHASRRRLQSESNDYAILFGGNILGEFVGPKFVASWDKNFYLLANDETAEQVYASDAGGGLQNIPIMYFAKDNPISQTDIPLGTTIEAAYAIGGVYGFLTISLEDAVDSVITNFALYTFNPIRNTFSETPISAGGQITPIIVAELVIGDVVVTELVGGFRQSIFTFDDTMNLSVLLTDAVTWIEAFDNVDAVVIEMSGYDDDVEDGFDFFRTLVLADDLREPAAESPIPAPESPIPEPESPISAPESPISAPTTDEGSSSGSLAYGWLTTCVVTSALLVMLD